MFVALKVSDSKPDTLHKLFLMYDVSKIVIQNKIHFLMVTNTSQSLSTSNSHTLMPQNPHMNNFELELESFMCQGKSSILSLICVWLDIVKY